METPTPTISVAVDAGAATLTGSGFRPQRAVCINVVGPTPASTFRKYVHPDRTGALSVAMPECTDPGAYSVRATQVGPGSQPVAWEFTK